jgi:hypothetical protein
MKTDARNYGIQREYGPRLEAPGPGVMSVEYERTWSVLAHLSTFLNLFTGFLGPVAAFVIWLVYKDDSPTVGARVEIGLLPGCLAQRHLYRVDHNVRTYGGPCGVPPRARHGRCDARTFRTGLLRGVLGLPGRWTSLFVG